MLNGNTFDRDVGPAELLELTDARGSEQHEEPKQGTSAMSSWWAQLFPLVSFQVVLALLMLVILFFLSRHEIADPDIWWHLHNAQYLVEHHELPRADMYSFTVAGHSWINHEWLSELPYYFAWRHWGLSGIHALVCSVLAITFCGLLYLAYRETQHFKASILAVSCSILLASVSFGPRTILFGYAYTVLLLILLQRLRQKGHAPLWVLPALFCVWINTHGSWLIGFVMFSGAVAAGMLGGQWGFVIAEPWTPRQRRNLLLAWVASLGALFVNPFGSRLVLYPFDLAFRQKLNIEHVAEWVSVDFHNTRGKLVMVVILILLISAILRPRKWTLAELGLVLFALYSGLTYIRFLVLLGIVAAPVLAKNFDFVPRYRRERDTPFVNAFVIVLIISAVAYFWPRSQQLQADVSAEYPVGASDYLKVHPNHGPMLNLFLWGGYLNWRDPDIKVFIDSRVDIFEYEGVLRDYLDLLALKDPQSLLEKYNIRYVLFDHNDPLTYALSHDPRWRVLYTDAVSVLFERAENAGAAAVMGSRSPDHSDVVLPSERADASGFTAGAPIQTHAR